MYNSRLAEKAETVQELLRKHTDECSTQSAELILFDELVQIDTEQFKHQAQMLSVNECVFQPQEMVVIVLVQFAV